MIHLHIKHKDAFQVLRYSGVKSWCFDVMYVDRESWCVQSVYIQANIFIELVIWLVKMCTVFPLYTYLCLVCISVLFSLFSFFLFHLFSFSRFCGSIFYKYSQGLTCPLGVIKGFKGLVAYAKCNCDSYESELVAYFSFSFILLEDEQKIGVGVCWTVNLPILRRLSPTFSSYNKLILRIFTCFIYVLWEIISNRANVVKRSEDRAKRTKTTPISKKGR